MFSNKIDTYVIFAPQNRFYFTKLETSFGCVILNENAKIFITDFRYGLAAKIALTDFDIVVTEYADLYKNVLDILKKLGAKNVGYEDDSLTVAQFKVLKGALSGFTLKAAGQILSELRAVKSEEEISAVAEAQILAQKALTKALPSIKAGVTEREVAAEIVYEMMRLGADSPSFDTIVAFGENSAAPHHVPSDKKLEKNDLILIDMGARLKGYCSDMTRTFCLGEPDAELAKIHSIVSEAQSYALRHIKAGMTCLEADSLAREYITANGYPNEFGHSLGHGVGINIHEAPRVSKTSDEILKTNMIITVEPGIYVEGLGGVRIEDLVVVKDDGIVNLTAFNKNINI